MKKGRQIAGLVAVIFTAGIAVVGWIWISAPSGREAFYGVHQAGIATAPQKFIFLEAFDATATNRDQLKSLFHDWTLAAQDLTQGKLVANDPGEIQGYRPARLTLTFGVGPSLFDARYGLADRKTVQLNKLPAFTGDKLDPQFGDGDLVIQACADDQETAYHAVHVLTQIAHGRAVPRWVQTGFRPGLETMQVAPGRNLQGFIDGIVNPDTSKKRPMDDQVWVTAPTWMQGGAYLVVRRIRMFVELWDSQTTTEKQTTIGREKDSGKELHQQAIDSHVRLAHGAGVEKIYRRGYNYVVGLDPATKGWDAGLIFMAWTNDPNRDYIPMQTRLADFDRLDKFTQAVGSAIFAILPGVSKSGDNLGQSLFQ